MFRFDFRSSKLQKNEVEKIVKHIHLDERARLDFDDGKVALAMDLML